MWRQRGGGGEGRQGRTCHLLWDSLETVWFKGRTRQREKGWGQRDGEPVGDEIKLLQIEDDSRVLLFLLEENKNMWGWMKKTGIGERRSDLAKLIFSWLSCLLCVCFHLISNYARPTGRFRKMYMKIYKYPQKHFKTIYCVIICFKKTETS